MGTKNSTTPTRPDRKTVCLGDMHIEATKALKSKRARNLSALVRQALRVYLQPGQQVFDTRPMIASLDQLRADLARVGSNLNQLSHGFNMHGPAAFNRDALAGSHEELREEFRKIMSCLLDIDRDLRNRNR
jgi:hypothetical protein